MLLYFKKRKKSLEEAVEIHKKLDSLPIQQLFLLPAVEITFLLFPFSIQHTGCLFLCYPNEKLYNVTFALTCWLDVTRLFGALGICS